MRAFAGGLLNCLDLGCLSQTKALGKVCWYVRFLLCLVQMVFKHIFTLHMQSGWVFSDFTFLFGGFEVCLKNLFTVERRRMITTKSLIM